MPRRFKAFTRLAVAVGSALFLMSPLAVSAVASTSFPAQGKGYFYNGSATGGTFVLSDSVQDNSTDSIPIAVNSKASLISFVENIYYNGSAQNKMGAAFIIQTMRSNGTTYNRNYPSASDVADWATRVSNYQGTINWHESKAQAGIDNNTINTFYTGNDIGWYRGSGSASPDGVIVFTSPSGSVDYMIKRNCGNPMGNLSGVPPVNPPQKPPGGATSGSGNSGSCSPMHIDVAVGTDYDGHVVPVTVSVGGTPIGTYSSSQTIDVTNTYTTGDQYTVQYTTGNYKSDYKARLDANGNNVYDANGYAIYDPVYTSSSWTSTIGPCYNYTLTPSITTNRDSSLVVEPSAPVVVYPSVSNSGPTKTGSVNWQLSQIVVAPGNAIPNAPSPGISPEVPCQYFSGPGVSCTPLVPLGQQSFGVGQSTPGNTSVNTTIGDYEAGTRICYALSLQPYQVIHSSLPATADWSHSAPSPPPTCLIVGKKPKVQVLGGDLMTGAYVNTSTSQKDIGGSSNTFGSWIEYGIFAVKSITGAASGSAYAGSGLAYTSNCKISQLSFTNSGSSSCSGSTVIGGYVNGLSIPDVASRFPAAGAPLFSGGDLSSLSSGVYTGSGTINISGGNIAAGKWIVINAPGATVNIQGNIQYFNGSMSSISDIPQVIIIANSLNIAGSVTQVDSWLLISGDLRTCSDIAVGAPLTSNVCSSSLVVNGPVTAGHLYLYRTAGSGVGAASGDPAEVFNLRPDAYLWASLRAVDPNRIQTVYSTELPPRL